MIYYAMMGALPKIVKRCRGVVLTGLLSSALLFVVFFAVFLGAFLFEISSALSSEHIEGHLNVTFHAFSDAYDRGAFDEISELFNTGLDVNMHDPGGRTALTYAAANAQNEIFAVRVTELLVAKGAKVNTEDSFGRAPIVYAIEEDRKVLAGYLLDNGADPTLQSRAYNTPIVFVPFVRQRPALASMIIAKCSDVNIRDSLGNTLLSWVSRFGYLDSVRLLLQAGAHVNNRSIHDKTPLMEAAEKGHYGVAELLVEKGADVNIQTRKGWSALMWASEKGYTEIVSMLIEAKADLFARNIKGERALTIARTNNHPETAKIIEVAEFRQRLKKIIIFGIPVILLVVLTVAAVRYSMLHRKSSDKG
ncbi:MAG: Ankyrin repeats (3 copies) [Syntrophorhabdus sp. PtaU1.Bin050]|nr:MAG: Ankyrin repeats (3 copies) [Syntrophorhabdus sp. PtaU1.Bin050]